ncbi:MAG: hypothetical protein SFY32_09220 [Bacteroidota bacterium]|nr:hypothetical protein [Bacteroidota bacterium]
MQVPNLLSLKFINKTKSIFLIFICQISFGQEFGGNPWNINWQEINSDTARIIFPKGLENQAQRVANIVHYLAANEKETIGKKHLKINIVLQNQYIIPNGYVGLAPWRSEFFMTPLFQSQELGSLPWHELLSLHEYRHVLQYSNSRRGVSKALYFLFGQQGWASSVFFAVPNWFWEGDAVVQETALSKQGRGRLPDFYNGLNSLALSNRVYRYMKVRNGSYKDFVPDHYKYGYIMNVYGRKHYGDDFWRYVFADAVRWEGIFYPFSRALRFHSGKFTKSFYRSTIQEFNKNELEIASQIQETSARLVHNVNKQTVTDYNQPYFYNENSILALKKSFKRIAEFVIIDSDKNEIPLTKQGLTIDEYYSYKNQKICWSEVRFHERRGYKNYSVIMFYDIQKRKKRQLTHKTKLFAPDISNSGSEIVALETNPELRYQLSVIDANTGLVKYAIPNPENLILTYPRWTFDDQFIICAARNDNGEMGIIKLDKSGNQTILQPFINHVIGPPFVTEKHVFYSASYDGSNQIYALDLETNKLFRLTKRKQNVYEPAVNADENTLFFAEFSHKGSRILSSSLTDNLWVAVEPVPLDSLKNNNWLPGNEIKNVLNTISTKKRESNYYNESSKSINIHSWNPILGVFNPEIGLAIQSDNIVNTLSIQAQSSYNLNDFGITSLINVAYARTYPVLYLNVGNVNGRRIPNDSIAKSVSQKYLDKSATFNEISIGPGIGIPLNLSSGLYSRLLEINGTLNYAQTSYKSGFNKFASFNNQLAVTNFHIDFINARKKALQNISRSWSQLIKFDNNYTSTEFFQTTLEGDFVFPGIFPNDNTVLMAGGQINNYNVIKDQLPYRFSDDFFYSRGYNGLLPYDYVLKISANYYFTLLYPDFGIANLLYLKRIRTNLFYDYSFFSLNNRSATSIADYNRRFNFSGRSYNNNSFGIELITDITFFNLSNFLIPLTFRLSVPQQTSFINQNSNLVFEIAFSPRLRL